MTFCSNISFLFIHSLTYYLIERNWVFVTNSVFVKPISLQPDDVNLWYFKLTIFDLIAFIAWNIKGLRHWVATILKLENQSLWQNSIPLTVTRILALKKLRQVIPLMNLNKWIISWEWDSYFTFFLLSRNKYYQFFYTILSLLILRVFSFFSFVFNQKSC